MVTAPRAGRYDAIQALPAADRGAALVNMSPELILETLQDWDATQAATLTLTQYQLQP